MEVARSVTNQISCNSEAEKFTDCLTRSLNIHDKIRVAGLICSMSTANPMLFISVSLFYRLHRRSPKTGGWLQLK